MSAQRPIVFHILYRFDVGGLERVIANCINEFPQKDYRHVIIALTEACDFVQHIKADIEIIALDKKPGLDWSIYKKMWLLFNKYKPQVCHSYNFSSLEFQFIAFLNFCPRRIHAEHGRDIDDPQGLNRKRNIFRKIMSFFTHKFIAVSADLETWLTNKVGISAKKVKLIYNGIDTNQFNLTSIPADLHDLETMFVIGTVARLTTIKDQKTLIHAFKQAVASSENGASLRLLIVGDGPCMEQLQQLTRKLTISEQVIFTGARADVSELLSLMNLFVLPSLSEGTPMCVLEAMACKTPIIASNVGGLPELIVEGTNGMLVPVGNIEQFAKAISFYEEHPDELLKQGELARNLALEKFSQHSMAQQYLEEYKGVS
jgi:sugar transferase (PEP-CTERM/EpsH1 system associated)